MKRLLLLLAVVLAIPVHIWTLPAPIEAQVVTFRETFDGAPGAPQSFLSQPWYARWDVAVHGRDNRYELRNTPFASHGLNCSGPPATHDTHRQFDQAVFQCKDHVMTAVHPDGYGLTYLTPNHLVDFSQGEAVIRWSMSTLRTSERDWIDVWITPYADNVQLPLNPGFPDLQGPPRRAVQVLMRTENSFCPNVWRDGDNIEDNQSPYKCRLTNDYRTWLTPDAARRDVFEIRISTTRLKIGMPDYNQWWYDHPLDQPLDWSRGVVQFGHHSYSPEKGTHNCPSGGCRENTWHWDDVLIQPAVPFQIIHTNRRIAEQSQPTLIFDRPAPANSHLRFSAWGSNVQYSTNAGVTWQTAQKAVQDNDCCHIFNYWTPLAEGAPHVVFRAGNAPTGWWQVKDVSVWATGDTGQPPPTAPTSTPTTSPSATPTAAASATLVPVPSATPEPTSTAVIAPSATPTGVATAPPDPSATPSPPPPDPSATPVPRLCFVWAKWVDGQDAREDWSPIDCAAIGRSP